MKRAKTINWIIGVDTGGTFTDLVLKTATEFQLMTYKLPSTPAEPEKAVLAGVRAIKTKWETQHKRALSPTGKIIHGSTVATNALLENKGAKVGFVTTAGFEDTLFIARQNRPELYALSVSRKPPPVKRAHCFGITERLSHKGEILKPLAASEIRRLIKWIEKHQFTTVAISLLHSYINPVHEKMIAQAVTERSRSTIKSTFPEIQLTVSHKILPEFREYERAATCIANAAVAPLMTSYLTRLSDQLEGDNLRIMVSDGGTLPVETVCKTPLHTIVSGPAGGVIGALNLAKSSGFNNIVTFDMGGTSTDVARCASEPSLTHEFEIGGLPVRFPIIDIHTVGAGGGSIAWQDIGGALRVGPQSAGANPGPAAYGNQTGDLIPTVTDAHVFLGHLTDNISAGGALTIKPELANKAIGNLAEKLKLSVKETALGILAVAEITMIRAIRKISVEQGFDPKDAIFVPFGGAGGLHAGRLADQMGIKKILISPDAGVLSAAGMIEARPQYRFSQSILFNVPKSEKNTVNLRDTPAVKAVIDQLILKGKSGLENDGVSIPEMQIEAYFDLRYQGQSHEITVPVTQSAKMFNMYPERSRRAHLKHVNDPIKAFEKAHFHQFGFDQPESDIELVTIRVLAAAKSSENNLKSENSASNLIDLKKYATSEIQTKKGIGNWSIIPQSDLKPGDEFNGPTRIVAYASTTLVSAGRRVNVLSNGAILMTETE